LDGVPAGTSSGNQSVPSENANLDLQTPARLCPHCAALSSSGCDFCPHSHDPPGQTIIVDGRIYAVILVRRSPRFREIVVTGHRITATGKTHQATSLRIPMTDTVTVLS
jgi:hypothetical protein